MNYVFTSISLEGLRVHVAIFLLTCHIMFSNPDDQYDSVYGTTISKLCTIVLPNSTAMFPIVDSGLPSTKYSYIADSTIVDIH